jgi:hypothetical protein
MWGQRFRAAAELPLGVVRDKKPRITPNQPSFFASKTPA